VGETVILSNAFFRQTVSQDPKLKRYMYSRYNMVGSFCSIPSFQTLAAFVDQDHVSYSSAHWAIKRVTFSFLGHKKGDIFVLGITLAKLDRF